MQAITKKIAFRYENLDAERATFLAYQSQLFAGHPHRWVLIKGEKIIGIFDTSREATIKGYEMFPLRSIYINQIEEQEQVETLYAVETT